MNRVFLLVCGSLVLYGCGNASGQGQQEAKKLADVLTGDAKKSAAENPVCKLFTVAEIGKYIGKPVTAGQNAALGSGCAWETKDESDQVLVQIVPAEYHQWRRDDKQLVEIGIKGFVRKGQVSADDWYAAAIKADESIGVIVPGPLSSENTATELLKETLKRYTKK